MSIYRSGKIQTYLGILAVHFLLFPFGKCRDLDCWIKQSHWLLDINTSVHKNDIPRGKVIWKPTIFGKVFVTNPPTPPFWKNNLEFLGSDSYEILHHIMVFVRWKSMEPLQVFSKDGPEIFQSSLWWQHSLDSACESPLVEFSKGIPVRPDDQRLNFPSLSLICNLE